MHSSLFVLLAHLLLVPFVVDTYLVLGSRSDEGLETHRLSKRSTIQSLNNPGDWDDVEWHLSDTHDWALKDLKIGEHMVVRSPTEPTDVSLIYTCVGIYVWRPDPNHPDGAGSVLPELFEAGYRYAFMYSTGFYDLSLLQLAASVPAPRIIVSWRDEIPTSDSPWSPLDANNLDYFSQTQRFFTIESGGSRSLMINFKTAQPKSGERVIPFKRRPATAITIKIARRPIAPPPEQVLTSEPPSDLIDMEAEFPAYLPPEFVLPLPAPAQGSSTAGGSSGHLLDS